MNTETSGKTGHVVIAGAGPGDPELITLRAARALEAADAVVYDRLASPELLDLCPAGCLRIFAGKAAGDHTMSQDEINALLIRLALEGHYVVRLKGGDPFVFGRGGEEGLALAGAGVSFEIIPGVSSALAAPAYAGIPVTHRGAASSVTFVTAHEDPEKPGSDVDWDHLAESPGTLVFLMGARSVGRIARKLIKGGMAEDKPAAIIENASTGGQRTIRTTLGQAPAIAQREEVSSPAVVVVGEVAALAGVLEWYRPENEEAPCWRPLALPSVSRTI